MAKKKLLIASKLAKLASTPDDQILPSTIRFYSEQGLLPVARTSQGGFRLFDPAHADRVRDIRRLQKEERLTIEEIKKRLGS